MTTLGWWWYRHRQQHNPLRDNNTHFTHQWWHMHEKLLVHMASGDNARTLTWVVPRGAPKLLLDDQGGNQTFSLNLLGKIIGRTTMYQLLSPFFIVSASLCWWETFCSHFETLRISAGHTLPLLLPQLGPDSTTSTCTLPGVLNFSFFDFSF